MTKSNDLTADGRWRLTDEEKARWAPFLHMVWRSIGPDAEPLLPKGRNRQACLIEMCIDANRPTQFSDITREEEKVLGRLWARYDRATMQWLRATLNY
jgi:hypothetical protein